MFRPIVVLICLLTAALPGVADAAPTPLPGGANAIVAISGKQGQTVFNGVLRIKILELRDATGADGTNGPQAPSASASQKVMKLSALLSNGTHEEFEALLHYTVADADAVTVDIPSAYLEHANGHMLQGASLRQSALFVVDKDFVPVKLVVDCATCGARMGFRPVRFTLGPAAAP